MKADVEKVCPLCNRPIRTNWWKGQGFSTIHRSDGSYYRHRYSGRYNRERFCHCGKARTQAWYKPTPETKRRPRKGTRDRRYVR